MKYPLDTGEFTNIIISVSDGIAMVSLAPFSISCAPIAMPRPVKVGLKDEVMDCKSLVNDHRGSRYILAHHGS